jgi:hypothetical protein
MGRRVNTYDNLPNSIKKRDTSGDMKLFMQAIDTAFDYVADTTLVISWDVENAPREELITMAKSLGLTPKNFMSNDTIRKFIRASGKIRELKGTDDLIEYLVDTLTQFKVYEVLVDENDSRTINVKIMRGTPENVQEQERMLEHLLNSYKKQTTNYDVTYVVITQVNWISPLNFDTKVLVKIQTSTNFNLETVNNSNVKLHDTVKENLGVGVDTIRFHRPFELKTFMS